MSPAICVAGEPPHFRAFQGTQRYLLLRICPSPQEDILRVTLHRYR